jgi:CubicO group peptidase (beta-lactamase class C family)
MLILPKFQPVADAFFELTKAQPYGGGALAIYQHGKPVVDIWAGEQRPGNPWQEDTKSVVFSTSKG